MVTRIKTGLLFLFLLTMNLACSDSHVIDETSFTLPGAGWTRVHILEGSWTSGKSISNGVVVLNITHNSGFKYQNLYLTGEISHSGETIQSDTFSIQLAKSNSGQWLGKTQGETFMVTDTLPFSLLLEPEVTYDFRFSQFSRDEVLKGIEEVEVQLIDN